MTIRDREPPPPVPSQVGVWELLLPLFHPLGYLSPADTERLLDSYRQQPLSVGRAEVAQRVE
jgi:hypothetical protein